MQSIKKVIKQLQFAEKMGVTQLHDCDVKEFHNETVIPMLQNKLDKKIMKPKEKLKYIGIEIECFTNKNYLDVIDVLYKLKLQDIINIGEDSSIEPDDDYDTYCYEFRILTKEKDFEKTMKRVDKFLKRIKAQVNDSCGLHIHLDMRRRNAKKCFNNLKNSQQLLFSLVDEERRDNTYCPYTNSDYDEYYGERGAIHKSRNYKTIEVRLHHSTLDMKTVTNWIKLLLLLINTRRKLKDVSTLKDIHKLKPAKSTKTYIKKNYKKYEKPELFDDYMLRRRYY